MKKLLFLIIVIIGIFVFSTQDANAESRLFYDYDGNFQTISDLTVNSGESISSIGFVEITSSGIINNYGTIDVTWKFNNVGIINNYGIINVSGTLTNLESGTINNFGGGYVGGSGAIINKGTIENSGITKYDPAEIELLMNNMQNYGTINNNEFGSIINGAEIINHQNGIINNFKNGWISSLGNNNINNQGVIINNCGGNITSDSTFILTGNPIQNDTTCAVIWDGGGDGEHWSDPKNWSNDKLPLGTDTIILGDPNNLTKIDPQNPEEPKNVFILLDIDFTLTEGTLTIPPAIEVTVGPSTTRHTISVGYILKINNHSNLTNQEDIINNGTIECTNGIIKNHNSFTNNQNFLVNDDCVLNNFDTANFDNFGSLYFSGEIINSGEFTNNDNIIGANGIRVDTENGSVEEAKGSFNNKGIFSNIKNFMNDGAVISNTDGGKFDNKGTISYFSDSNFQEIESSLIGIIKDFTKNRYDGDRLANHLKNDYLSSFTNSGKIILSDLDILYNQGKFTNTGTLDIFGKIYNSKESFSQYYGERYVIEVLSSDCDKITEVYFLNQGTITITTNPNVLIGDTTSVDQHMGGLFENHCLLKNTGAINIYETILGSVFPGGLINKNNFVNEGKIDNHANLLNSGYQFVNYGTINNFDTFDNYYTIINHGKIINEDIFNLKQYHKESNRSTSDSNVSSMIQNFGEIINKKDMIFSGNFAKLENTLDAFFFNEGSMIIDNGVGIENYGVFDNSNILKIGHTLPDYFGFGFGSIPDDINPYTRHPNFDNHYKFLNIGTVENFNLIINNKNAGITNDNIIENFGKIDNEGYVNNRGEIFKINKNGLFLNNNEFENENKVQIIGCFKNNGNYDEKGTTYVNNVIYIVTTITSIGDCTPIPKESFKSEDSGLPETTPNPTPETTPNLADEILSQTTKIDELKEIPKWIKNNAQWYGEKKISDKDFATGIGFMIKEEILKVDGIKIDKDRDLEISDNIKIPDWVQNNAKWWAEDLIPDADFKAGIAFLVKEKVIDLSYDGVESEKIQSINSFLNEGLLNSIISNSNILDKEKSVQNLVQIATINQISSQINLDIRNYLEDYLDDELDRAWNQHSEEKTTETQQYAMSVQKIIEENKIEINKGVTLVTNSIQARDNLLNSAQELEFDKFNLDKTSMDEFENYGVKIKNESDVNIAIKELKTLKSEFGKSLSQLNFELGINNHGSTSDTITVWCEPLQLDVNDSKLVSGVCAEIPNI